MPEMLVKGSNPSLGINSGLISAVISAIKSEENESRKKISLRETDVFNDKIYLFVQDYLEREAKFSENTLNEIPIVSSINLASRIVKQEASIYKNEPERKFTDLSDDQEKKIRLMYKDFKVNQKLKIANQAYKLQKQTHVMLKPKNGKIKPYVIRNHNIDVIPDPKDPENALAYIISIFDQSELHLDLRDDKRRWRKDITNTKPNKVIGDPQDYKSVTNRYLVWSKEYQFIIDDRGNVVLDDEDFDADGNLIPESIENPLREQGIVPIYDISGEKNFRYFIDEGNAIVDFTVAFNADWSMLMQVQKMQGFSQAIVKGDPSVLPKDIRIGPNYIIYLPSTQSANGTPIDTDFDFRNPNPDLRGNLDIIESKLASFLTSRGLDPQLVTGNSNSTGTYASGIERLLAMVEKFDATRDDLDLFEFIESDIYEGIKAWHNVLIDSDLLNNKYKTTAFPEESEVEVKFSSPEMIKTDKEMLDIIEKKIERGLSSRIGAIMDYYDVERPKAEEIAMQIDMDNEAENIKRIELFDQLNQQESDGESEGDEGRTE